MEIWKDVVGYEGFYQVSNQGRVKSLDRNIKHKNGRVYYTKGKILKTYLQNGGYLIAHLNKNGKMKNCTVHRLVATAFIENPEEKAEIDHINTIKTDNRVENLRWVTRSENFLNPLTRVKNSEARKGREKESLKKKVICLNTKEIFKDMFTAAEKYNLRSSNLTRCCQGKQISFGKDEKGNPLLWKYLDEYIPEIDDLKEYRNPQLKRVRCLETGEEFESIKEAAQKCNVVAQNISEVCRGKRKTAGGKRWEFIDV